MIFTAPPPPKDPAAWIGAFSLVEIPLLSHTAEELLRLRENEDRVVARDISRVVMKDPMLTLRLLRFLQARRRASATTDITTVEHALMMLGVSPFFRHFQGLPVVESVLAEHPQALQGLMRVVDRAHFAACYAADWAGVRHDHESDEVVVAALLHDMAEMLLWCFAPDLALRIQQITDAQPTMRSSAAQRMVLGFGVSELQLGLIAQWKLPDLLQSLMDDTHASHPRAVNVLLAVDLARHSAKGWNDPALPDDYAAIASFLRLSEEDVLQRIRRCSQQVQDEQARRLPQAAAEPEGPAAPEPADPAAPAG